MMAVIENPQCEWLHKLQGVHLFHFDGAPCAQRVRFALAEKGLQRGREIAFASSAPRDCEGEPGRWVSRQVSLVKKDHLTDEYARIQPNLVVPALVHDGVLHIESMEIIAYLDSAFGGTPLAPTETKEKQDAEALTRLGEELHRSIRFVTFRWGLGKLGQLNRAEEEKLKALVAVGGDGEKLVEFYEGYDDGSIPAEIYLDHLKRLTDAFADLETQLSDRRKFLTGANLSMADVIWAMKTMRLMECGYPFKHQFPNVYAWFERIRTRPSFQAGVMGKHRMMHRAFRAKAAVETLLGGGLQKEVLRLVA